MSTPVEAVVEGVRRFNRQQFYEAHEVLEESWQSERGERRLFLQGLIQICAGFYHFQNGNLRGAAELLARGSAKLREYPDQYFGMDLASILQQVGVARRRIEGMRDGAEPEAIIDFPTLPVPEGSSAESKEPPRP